MKNEIARATAASKEKYTLACSKARGLNKSGKISALERALLSPVDTARRAYQGRVEINVMGHYNSSDYSDHLDNSI